MTSKVWKYAFPIDGTFTLALPRDAQILDIQTQHNTPVLWALVDPNAGPELRTFQLVGTGHPIEGHGSYIRTFQFLNGLVFHVFEDEKEQEA